MADQNSDPLAFTVKDIDGNELALEKYRGKAVLFVNVASECGFTPQYKGLEELWQRYKDEGLVILGFPSNDFGAQEPGSDEEIKSFCSAKFGVTFPMFSKSPVLGPQSNPVFKSLSAQAGEPKWNFHKYLLSPKGKITAFSSRVEPLSSELTTAVEQALA